MASEIFLIGVAFVSERYRENHMKKKSAIDMDLIVSQSVKW